MEEITEYLEKDGSKTFLLVEYCHSMGNGPVRIVSYEEKTGKLVLHNYMDFDDMKDFLEIRYELTQDGTMVEEGILTEVSAASHQDTETELVLNIPETKPHYNICKAAKCLLQTKFV
mgnify:FL=1